MKVYGTLIPEMDTIRRWYATLDCGRTLLNFKVPTRAPYISNLETRIEQLLEEDPRLSATKMADLLKVSVPTVVDRLTNSLGRRLMTCKWVPHLLPHDLKEQRVETSKEMLLTLSYCEQFSFKNVVTLDESWIYLDYPPAAMWRRTEDPRIEAIKSSQASRKCLLTLVFSGMKVLLAVVFPENQTMNSERFISEILIPLKEILDKETPTFPYGVFLHCDNASSHRSSATKNALTQLEFMSLEQPPYSPDISPCDFFAFGTIKRLLTDSHHTCKAEIEETLVTILKTFSPSRLQKVFHHWMRRLRFVISSGGEYYDEEKERSLQHFNLTYPPSLAKDEKE
jgi:histone-lysine N-methyltransferase SETMAR